METLETKKLLRYFARRFWFKIYFFALPSRTSAVSNSVNEKIKINLLKAFEFNNDFLFLFI
jgi:hypothetical protein